MFSRGFKNITLLLSLVYGMDGALVWTAHHHAPRMGAAACHEHHCPAHRDDVLGEVRSHFGGHGSPQQPVRPSRSDDHDDCAACRYLAKEPLPALPVVSTGAARPVLLRVVRVPQSAAHPLVKVYHSRAPPFVV